MGVRQVFIDSRIAEEAEHVADAAGYTDLDHYVMALIEEDLNRIERSLAVVNATEEGDGPPLSDESGGEG